MSADPILQRAIEVARAELPPRLDPNRAQRMVERALQAHAPDRSSRPTSWTRWLWLGVPIAAAIVLWLFTRPTAATLTPSELVLPTGDRIASLAGTQLDVTAVTASQRAIRIAHGIALFDVRPLADGESFIVHTPDTDVVVTGTVFSVEVAAGATTVRVYEGHVRARQGGVQVALPAGSQLGPNGGVAAISGDPLGELAAERARLRIAARDDGRVAVRTPDAASPTTDPPDPEPVAAPQPIPAPRRAPGAVALTDPTEPPPAADAPSEPVPQVEAQVDRSQVVALLAAGNHAAARDLARAHRWHVLEGDAHRGLGAHASAVAAYERALQSTEPDDACIAGLRAARLYADQLAMPARALELLERAALPTCPTRERALAHTLQLASRLSRSEVGRDAARRYLAAFPRGASATLARSFVSASDAARP